MSTFLSIIILSYNTKDLTIRCIESIIEQYRKELKDRKIEIIVVDNASTDGSPSAISNLKSQISNIKLVENKENFGFAKGCNIGAKAAKGKYILFLNSDTQVLDKGFLKMIEFLEKNNYIGILGGKLLNSDRSPQPSAGKFYTIFNFLLLIIGGEKFGWLRGSPKQVARADWVSGACFMIGRKLFEKLKGFDEHFFMYMEDMELCFRGKLLGFPTCFYPDVKIVHQSLGSSNRKFAIKNIDRGILYFYKKHKSYWQYLVVKTLLTAKGAIRV
ncbi:MAG: glycosyltransferase family 2 protein [Patescibacteria group bacterium]